MAKYRVICIDMFQTLVDVTTRTKKIWQRILQNDYTEELKNKYIELVNNKIINKFHIITSQNTEFKNLKQIFEESFKEIFGYENANYDSISAMKIFIDEHNKAALYDDSLDFLQRVKKKYKLCLVSDTDIDMVKNHLEYMNFDSLFISEEINSYKGNLDGKIFRAVLEHYEIQSSQVVHIGDSSSDMYGANRINIDTCWINRHRYKKQFEFNPTYSIESLKELYSILNI